MRVCPECGAHNDALNNFCGQCGIRIANVCPSCRYENLLTQEFCGDCGKQLIKTAITPSPSTDIKKKDESQASLPQEHPSDRLSARLSELKATASVAAKSEQTAIASIVTLDQNKAENVQEIYKSDKSASTEASDSRSEVLETSPEPPARSEQAVTQAREYQEENPREIDRTSVAAPAPEKTIEPQEAASSQETMSSMSSETEEETIEFTPPILTQHRGMRQAQITYDATLKGLTLDIRNFLDGQQMTKGQFVSLIGSDGLGKSHIIQMARTATDPADGQQTQSQAFWLGAQHYRCFYPNRVLLQGWIDIIQNMVGLTLEGYPAQDVKLQVDQFLGFITDGHPPDSELQAFLYDFLSANPIQQLQLETRDKLGLLVEYLTHLLKLLAAQKPLILLLDDLHYADTATLDVLEQILKQGVLLQSRILIIASFTRDFYFSGQLEQTIQQTPYKEYVVGDLNDAELEAFMNEGPLGGQIHVFPTPLLGRIIQHSLGLPIFLEETLRLLHQKGILSVDARSGKFVPGDMSLIHNIHIPDSLSELIQTRLSMLSSKARYLLQLASVVGERFPISLLLSLSQDKEDEFNQTLTDLLSYGILIPDTANTGRFRHGLIWRSVYNHIEPDFRRQLHQLVSQTLESDYNQGISVNPCLMAYHAEQGQLLNRALDCWNLAGVHAGQVGNLTALNLAMFRGLELVSAARLQPLVDTQLDELDELENLLIENLGIYNSDDNPGLATKLLRQVIRFYKEHDNSTKLIELYGILASCYENQSNIEQALVCVNESASLISKQDYPVEYAALLTSKAEYLYTLGRLEDSRQLILSDIEPGFASESFSGEPEYLNTALNARLILGEILLDQANMEGFELLEQSLSIAREKRLEGLAIALKLARARGFIRHGNYERCDQEADGLLHEIEAMASPDWFLAQWGLLAMEYHCAMGDWDSAKQLMLTVISKSELSRDFHTSIMAQAYAGYVAFQLGQTDQGHQLLEQAVTNSSNHRFARCALIGWLFLAELELAQGNIAVARDIAKNALHVAEKPDIRHTGMRFALTQVLARCLIIEEKLKEAGKILESLWPEVISSQFQPAIAETATCIGELYKNLARHSPADVSKQQLMKSIQFYQKAQGIWLDTKNRYKMQKVREATPKL